MAFTKGHKINLGRYKSKEVREKISLSQKKRLTDPQKRLLCKKARKISSGNLGKKHSEEAKKKMSLAHIGQKKSPKAYSFPKGENHPMWKGGKGTERHREMGTSKYKNWRMKVFLRDNFTCQFCYERGCYLEAHHIKGWAKYPKLRYVIDNGITLCGKCHNLTKK